MPLPTPPQKDIICCWDWGEGVAGFNLAQKKRARYALIMRWTMTMTMTMTMARGGSKRKSINDSISEHKCIVKLREIKKFLNLARIVHMT